MNQNVEQSSVQQSILEPIMQEELPSKEQPIRFLGKIFLVSFGVILLIGIAGYSYYLATKKNGILNREQAKISHIIVQPTVEVSPTAIPQQSIDNDFWRTDTSSFSAQELTSMKTLLLKNGEPSDGKLVVVGLERGRDWAMLSITTLLSSTNQLRQTTPATALAHKDTNGIWTITSQGDPNFCSQLKQASQPLSIGTTDYNYFCGQ